MLFQIYGETAGYQLLGWLLAFLGLIAANECAVSVNPNGACNSRPQVSQ